MFLMPLVALAFAAPDGAKIFEERCSSCHRTGSDTRAPLPAVLRELPRDRIRKSLESGTMKEQGAQLSAEERMAVSTYLSLKVESTAAVNSCPGPIPKLTALRGWNGWSPSAGNTRYVPVKLDPSKIKLAWAFGYANSANANGQPAVVDGVLYTGSEKGVVYALDTKSGCEYWRFQAEATVRTAMVIAQGRVMFGDTKANAYAIDAATGALLWKAKLDEHPFARVTGSPAMHSDRIYFPLSSAEEVPAANPKYPCCSFRGSVVALEAATGKQAWKSYTIPEPPGSGGAIWLTPTIDAKRNVLYVGTGNAYQDPESPFTDAVIAFDLATGARKWHRQMTPNDRWNMACVSPNKDSCPKDPGDDFDFGASPLLVTGSDGKDRVIIGQKSGIVHALDHASEGKILWQTRVGKGGMLGGVEFGIGADALAAYVPVSDWNGRDPETGGGLFALQITTGEKLWSTPPPGLPCKGTPSCNSAQMAPPTVLSNVVLSGSMDGHLRAYDVKTGQIVWDFDTLQSFETVNKVAARGGALNAVGPVIANGMMFVQSGYGSLGGMPGNLLLAFSIE